MWYCERYRDNQVIEASIDGVSDWRGIATEISGAAIGCSEGVKLGRDSIDHEKDGVIDPGIDFVELSSEGDRIMRNKVGPSPSHLIWTARITYKNVVTLIRRQVPPTMR